MGIGILVCGANGSGKSTLGRALAQKLDFYFIDNEDLYFSKADTRYIYADPRSRDDVERLLMNEVEKHQKFVFAAVRGDYGKDIIALYNYAVFIDVPKEIGLQRVRNRSFQKFGERMLKGGDLYEPEERFFQRVSSRPADYAEIFLQALQCPIIRIDGTKPTEENVRFIIEQIQSRIPIRRKTPAFL